MSDEKFQRDHVLPIDPRLWGDFEQTLDEALNTNFDSIEFETPLESAAPTIDETGLSLDSGIREMQETLLDMVRLNLNPVARYVKALHAGEDAKEIYEITELVVTPIIGKVEQAGLIGHAEDLTFFRSLLLLAMGETDQHAKAKLKDIVCEGFNDVTKKFGLYCRGYRKAVLNLVELYRALKAVDNLSEHDLRRVFAVGIPSLSWFKKMKSTELSNLSGVSETYILKIKEIANHSSETMRYAATELTGLTKETSL